MMQIVVIKGPNDHAFVSSQIEYYKKRALEYDEFWDRRGRYDCGDESNKLWFDNICEINSFLLDRLNADDFVLEVASGTGFFTLQAIKWINRMDVVDGSSEMISILQQKLQADENKGLQDKINHFEVMNVLDNDWEPMKKKVFSSFHIVVFIAYPPFFVTPVSRQSQRLASSKRTLHFGR